MGVADQFIPEPDIRDEHHIDIRSPADAVLDLAMRMDVHALPVVYAVTRAARSPVGSPAVTGLLKYLQSLGWGVLATVPGRTCVLGVVGRLGSDDIEFMGVPPDQFAAFCEPGMVKIVTTLEVAPIAFGLTRLTTETRVEPTDQAAFCRFHRYWIITAPGAVLARVTCLRALKRQAEGSQRLESRQLTSPCPRASGVVGYAGHAAKPDVAR